MSNKIEQKLEELEAYISTCKTAPFSSKILVDKEELEDLIAKLRNVIPEEIKRCQKISKNKDAILADAQKKADEIISRAEVHTTEMLSEHQIMQQAYDQAREIIEIAQNQAQETIDSATNDANIIRTNAIEYLDSHMIMIEEILSNSIQTTEAHNASFLSSLKGIFEVISENRSQLHPNGESDPEPEQEEQPVSEQEKNTAESGSANDAIQDFLQEEKNK